MHKFLLCASLSVMLATMTPQAGEIEMPSEVAMNFVGQFSDDQLSGMLSRIGGRSQAMMEMSQLGGEFVAQVFNLQIDIAVEKYGDQWQLNMATAWDPLLNDLEMASIMTEGATSPFSDKYTELRPQAGQAMQAISQDLFRDILVEVISETRRTLAEQAQE